MPVLIGLGQGTPQMGSCLSGKVVPCAMERCMLHDGFCIETFMKEKNLWSFLWSFQSRNRSVSTISAPEIAEKAIVLRGQQDLEQLVHVSGSVSSTRGNGTEKSSGCEESSVEPPKKKARFSQSWLCQSWQGSPRNPEKYVSLHLLSFPLWLRCSSWVSSARLF